MGKWELFRKERGYLSAKDVYQSTLSPGGANSHTGLVPCPVPFAELMGAPIPGCWEGLELHIFTLLWRISLFQTQKYLGGYALLGDKSPSRE